MRDDGWTPAQAKLRDRLLAEVRTRPWWVFVAGATAPLICQAQHGWVMRWDHTSWRSTLPPCDRPEGCSCTIRAVSTALARSIARGSDRKPGNGGL